METKRIDYFDMAKGIGILAVLVGHMGLIKANKFIYSFHMPLFFLISGYFLSDKLSVEEMARKKAKQLLIPYVFTCICILILSIATDLYHNCEVVYNFTLWAYASFYGSGAEYLEPFWIKAIGAIWFLLAMFFAVLIVRYAIQTKYAALLIGGAAYVGYATTPIVWLPFSIQAGAMASFFVYIGYCAKKEKILEKKPSLIVLFAALLVWIFCIIDGELYMVSNTYKNGMLDIIGAVCATYVILILCKKFASVKWIATILTFYGKNTLIFLCFHLIELNMFPWTRVSGFLNGCGIYGYLCTGIICMAKLAWATLWILFVKRVPLMRKLFGVSAVKIEEDDKVDVMSK